MNLPLCPLFKISHIFFTIILHIFYSTFLFYNIFEVNSFVIFVFFFVCFIFYLFIILLFFILIGG